MWVPKERPIRFDSYKPMHPRNNHYQDYRGITVIGDITIIAVIAIIATMVNNETICSIVITTIIPYITRSGYT